MCLIYLSGSDPYFPCTSTFICIQGWIQGQCSGAVTHPFWDHSVGVAARNFFKFLKKVRILLPPFPPMLSGTSPPLPFPTLLPAAAAVPCWSREELQSHFCPTPAVLCGEPGSPRGSVNCGDNWALPPFPIPLSVPHQPETRHRDGKPACDCHHCCHCPQLRSAPHAAWLSMQEWLSSSHHPNWQQQQ